MASWQPSALVYPSTTYAADALRAARRLVENRGAGTAAFSGRRLAGTIAHWNSGCPPGRSTVGVIGSRERLEFTVIGDAVNCAAKLEDANKSQGTKALTDKATF